MRIHKESLGGEKEALTAGHGLVSYKGETETQSPPLYPLPRKLNPKHRQAQASIGKHCQAGRDRAHQGHQSHQSHHSLGPCEVQLIPHPTELRSPVSISSADLVSTRFGTDNTKPSLVQAK